MKRLLATIILAVPAALSAQSQASAPTVVNLDDAIALADQHSTQMRNSRNTLRASKLSLTQAYAALLPSLSTSLSFRPAQNGSVNSFTSQLSTGISFLNYTSWLNIGSRKRALENTEAGAVTTRFQLRATVQQQYFGILQAQEALTQSRKQREIAQANFELMRARVRTQTVVSTDSLNSLNSLISSDIAISTAENNIANQIRTFSRTLGIEYLVQPDPRDTANFALVQLDSVALLGMLRDAPQVVQSRTSIANAKFSLRQARFAYLPIPTGSIGFSRGGSGESVFGFTDKSYRYTGGQPSLSFSAGLQIFNGFQREAALINAREGLENSEIAYRDLQLNLESQLLNQIASIRTTEKNLELQVRQIMTQEEAVKVVGVRYELDMVTSLEVLQAQNTLSNARNALINSRYTYRNQIAALEQLVGRQLR